MARGKVKGSLVMQTVKYIRSKGDEGKRLVPDHLKHYLNGRVRATSWHSEEEHLELMHATTELFGGPGSNTKLSTWEELGRATAPVFFKGAAYDLLIRKGDPSRALASFGSLWKLRHDTGDIAVQELGPREAIISLADFSLVSEKMCATIKGMLRGVLESAEVSNLVVSHTECTSHGGTTCAWHLRWE